MERGNVLYCHSFLHVSEIYVQAKSEGEQCHKNIYITFIVSVLGFCLSVMSVFSSPPCLSSSAVLNLALLLVGRVEAQPSNPAGWLISSDVPLALL